jgi:C4-dicarboxylate-specific signal transduction histidine kinase
MQSQKLDPADYQKVVSSPNRYAAAVQWHKRQQAQAEIGDDPAAFRAKLEAEILARSTAELQTARRQQAQLLPRTRHALQPRGRSQRRLQKRPGLVWPALSQDIFDHLTPGLTPASVH